MIKIDHSCKGDEDQNRSFMSLRWMIKIDHSCKGDELSK